MQSDYQTRQYPYMRQQYIFNEQDIPAAEQLMEALQNLKPQEKGYAQKPYYGDLTVALRRFHQAYTREIPEDQVIDLAIALDSSLFDKKDTELKYRFSLRGAAILTMAKVANWNARKSQFFLNVMYDVRSAIVHSGLQITDLEKPLQRLERVGLEPRHFLLYCEDIVREILRAYVIQLAKGKSKKTIIENLDLYVVESIEAQSHLETDENS
jgi:Apea-like HEPN